MHVQAVEDQAVLLVLVRAAGGIRWRIVGMAHQAEGRGVVQIGALRAAAVG
ncbi:hypothetical protein D3C78_612300 [compost metagenome]